MEYNIEDLTVLHLNAGKDTNGNPRRVYVLAHPTAGFLAAVDEGHAGWQAIASFDVETIGGSLTALRNRILPTLDTSPSQRTRLLSQAVQASFAARRTVVRVGSRGDK